MRNENSAEDTITKAAIASVAAASNTPFKTAFKISMGIAAAQFVVLGLFVGGFFALAIISYLVFR